MQRKSLYSASNTRSLRSLHIADSARVPICINPHATIAETEVAAWARQIGLQLPHMNLVLSMASFLYPTTSLERLIIIGKMMFLLFYIDDVYGDSASSQGLQTVSDEVFGLIEKCCNAFSSQQAPQESDVLVRAFLEVRHEMEGYAPPTWMKRFSESLSDHLICSVTPSLYGWNAQSQSIPTYIFVRERISGMYPTIDFIEFANDGFLPTMIIERPIISKLRLCCARIACLTNDLFSYYKEIVKQGLLLNLVQVIQTTQHCGFDEAVDTAIKLINETTSDFFEGIKIARQYNWNAGSSFDAETSAVVDGYLTGLEYEISATWHWQMSTNRYRSSASPFVDLTTPVL